MNREQYRLFREGQIGNISVANRLVRSATFDPPVWRKRTVTERILSFYGEIACGGVGLIITGNVPVMAPSAVESYSADQPSYTYIQVPKYGEIASIIHNRSDACKVFAMLMGHMLVGPSAGTSLRWNAEITELSMQGISETVDCFVSAIADMKALGFDGVQLQGMGLHSCLSYFLSPYYNHRTDAFGGSAENRTRIVTEIVSKARKAVGDFPIIIKVCGTDNLKGGMDIDLFPEMVKAIEKTGVDAIEITGMPYAPHRKETEPHPYFLEYAETADVNRSIISVGGHRDAEEIEKVLQRGKVDYVALCRPLICEPDLPNRWLSGEGSSQAECISCNSCQYSVRAMGQDHAMCLYKHDKENYRNAQDSYAS